MLRLTTALRCALSLCVLTAGTSTLALAQTANMSHPPMRNLDGAAKLVAMSGQVSVDRDGRPWALNVNDYVQPLQVIITGSNGSAMFKVADGSTFEVFPNSKVVFRANRGNWDDLLEIMLGKIKVQIEHLGGAPNRNKVRTPTAVISVRGTTFNVEYNAEAQFTTVVNEEGSVEVARATRLDDKKILNANESIVVYKNEPLGKAGIDKGNLAQRIVRGAMDALVQQAINSRTGTPSAAGTGTVPSVPSTGTGTSAGDKDNSAAPVPPAPPPPPPPAQ